MCLRSVKTQEINEIIACLPEGRTPFHYFKDRYALELLRHYVGEGKSIREIRASRFGRLLNKPLLKTIAAASGDGRIARDRLRAYWPAEFETYRLTLGKWGEENSFSRYWDQVSRPGRSLVLHMNFNSKHNRAYRQLLRTFDSGPLDCYGHPAAGRREKTMSWARMDIDLAGGEALIEEIQNDWFREAEAEMKVIGRCTTDRERQLYVTSWYEKGPRWQNFVAYEEEVLGPHRKVWAEATLSAAIWFLCEELRVKKIFYHTHETGCRLKGMDHHYGPPRSLYTTLPRRFCFEESDRAPEFIERKWARRFREQRRQKIHNKWHLLEL